MTTVMSTRTVMAALLSALSLCGCTRMTPGDPCTAAARLFADAGADIGQQQTAHMIFLCPDGAAGHLARGVQYEQAGAAGKAEAEYRQATVADPELAPAHGHLGLLLLDRGATDEAAGELSRAVAGSSDPRYAKALARLLATGGAAALQRYYAGVALNDEPDDPQLRLWLADALAAQGQDDQSVIEYNKLLDLDPGNGQAHRGLAAVYERSGRLDDAIRSLAVPAGAAPAGDEIHRRLAELYRRKGDLVAAEKEMALTVADRGGDADSIIRLGDQYLLSRDYDKAIESYLTALKKEPDAPAVLEKLGDAQMAAGRDDEAVDTYQRTLKGGGSGVAIHCPWHSL